MALLRKGDLVEFDFSPSKGHEPAGRRPGLVVSSDEFNWSTSMTLVCPVTTRANYFPLHLELPDELEERYGCVALEQVRAFDMEARNPTLVAHFDDDAPFMERVTSVLKSFFG